MEKVRGDWDQLPRGVRHLDEPVLTLPEYFDVVQKFGWDYCELIRDHYMCTGERYERVLGAEAPFNRSLALQNLPAGTKILAVGNSHLYELLLAPLCHLPAEAFVYRGIRGNTHVFYLSVTASRKRGAKPFSNAITFVLLDNDIFFEYPSRIERHLTKANFTPTHVLVGRLNDNMIGTLEAATLYKRLYPKAKIIKRYEGKPGKMMLFDYIGVNCRGDFQQCLSDPAEVACEKEHTEGCKSYAGHQCYPGPIVRLSGIFFFFNFFFFNFLIFFFLKIHRFFFFFWFLFFGFFLKYCIVEALMKQIIDR